MRPSKLMLLLPFLAIGCTHPSPLSGPQDLGLAAKFEGLSGLPVDMDPETLASGDPGQLQLQRDEILARWVLRSDSLCSDYQERISQAVRDSRLGTDLTASTLSGLATIFTKVGMIHPLSGAATIVMALGGDLQSDLFLQQTGDIIVSSIQTIRTAARKTLQSNWSAPYAQYTLAEGLLDVERYDRETCNLDAGIAQIRSALKIAGPTALTLNNPIVGARPTAETPTGTATTSPQTTTVVPATTTTTPNGTVVITPPQVSTTPTPSPTQSPANQQPRPQPQGQSQAQPTGQAANAGAGQFATPLDRGCRAHLPDDVAAGKRALIKLVAGIPTEQQADAVAATYGGPSAAQGLTNKRNDLINRISERVCNAQSLANDVN